MIGFFYLNHFDPLFLGRVRPSERLNSNQMVSRESVSIVLHLFLMSSLCCDYVKKRVKSSFLILVVVEDGYLSALLDS